MSKPLSWSTPVDKVCEKLKKKDVQICDLRFGKILIPYFNRFAVNVLVAVITLNPI